MSAKLDDYIGKVEHLPAAPTVVIKLLALFRQPDRDLDEIVELMRQDPSLTAEVLRHSNSAYFGHEAPILDVFEALMRLGFFQVYQMAVARFGSQTLSMANSNPDIDMQNLWRHSLASAVTAGTIASKLEENEGLAFTAGLLHDVGKIVMASAEGAKYAALVTEFGIGGSSLRDAEMNQFGFGHNEVGAALLNHWGLPEDISTPVRRHHDVQWAQPHERLCAIVSLGNFMAHLADAKPLDKTPASQGAVCAMHILQFGEADMAKLLQESQENIKRFTGILGGQAK